MAYRNTARAGYFARSTEKRGVNPRRRNGTVRCMFFPTAQRRGHSRERGRLCGKNGLLPHAPSQDIRFRLFLAAFSPECMQVHKNVCTKVWKNFGAFLLQKPAGAYAPILYGVKNDKLWQAAIAVARPIVIKKFPKGEVSIMKKVLSLLCGFLWNSKSLHSEYRSLESAHIYSCVNYPAKP